MFAERSSGGDVDEKRRGRSLRHTLWETLRGVSLVWFVHKSMTMGVDRSGRRTRFIEGLIGVSVWGKAGAVVRRDGMPEWGES
jgi:hypothetical protein